MPLNSEQREAVRLIKEWELINTDRYFILDGAAGVGIYRLETGSECPFGLGVLCRQVIHC